MELELLVFFAQVPEFFLHFQGRKLLEIGRLRGQIHEIFLFPVMEGRDSNPKLSGQFSQSPPREQKLHGLLAKSFGMPFLTLEMFHKCFPK